MVSNSHSNKGKNNLVNQTNNFIRNKSVNQEKKHLEEIKAVLHGKKKKLQENINRIKNISPKYPHNEVNQNLRNKNQKKAELTNQIHDINDKLRKMKQNEINQIKNKNKEDVLKESRTLLYKKRKNLQDSIKNHNIFPYENIERIKLNKDKVNQEIKLINDELKKIKLNKFRMALRNEVRQLPDNNAKLHFYRKQMSVYDPKKNNGNVDYHRVVKQEYFKNMH